MAPAILALIAALTCPGDSLRLAVAASMKDAGQEIARAFEQAFESPVEIVAGSSGQLASQVRYGAPIDVLISAADEPLEQLERDGLLVAGSKRQIASNRLVLISPGDAKKTLRSFRDLAGDNVRRVAIGDPATVPAGQYAEDVFRALDLSDGLREKIVHAPNVRQVLAYVERGEVDAGVVYATDAKLSAERVRIVELAAPEWHRPIRYCAALIRRDGGRESAQELATFLNSESAQEILRKHGFLAHLPQALESAPATQAAAGAPLTTRPVAGNPAATRPAERRP